ncbi:response regulator [Desulfopila inferna]|uniref:response regulator n=1 Tax=Desulfopila inferna TaxID=468528 RepID=UPI0019661399|nr:response regulator transcription factor [Desulfopila inferna]MBM9603871.1 response regulator transcription factor [Desulfopila inferna]
MNIKIALADDHNLVRRGLVALLQACPDITVIGEAEDGFAAFDLAKKLAPDILIIDIGMPQLNGINAIELISGHSPEIALIVLTVHSEERYVSSALQAGARGYLLKTCSVDELIRAIHTVYRGHYYLCPEVADLVIHCYKDGISPPDFKRPTSLLTSREREVLQLLAEGMKIPIIAQRLNISAKTVESHRRNIMEKLGLKQQVDLIKYALRQGVVQFDSWITKKKNGS